jgi:hypothetical protein
MGMTSTGCPARGRVQTPAPSLPAAPVPPAYLFKKKSTLSARMQLLHLHVPHTTAAPSNLPMHASAPTHAVARLMPASAHFVPADAHTGGDRILCSRFLRLLML